MTPQIQAVLAGCGPATYIQCAQDGIWEKALGKQGDLVLPDFVQFERWYANASDFALEIFFSDTNARPLFAGMRWRNTAACEIFDLLSEVQQIVQQQAGVGNAIATLDMLAEKAGLRFLDNAVDFLELGVNNLWKSVGPCRLWTAGDSVPDAPFLRSKITTDAPQLLMHQSNALMLEVAADLPRPHWLGICVSRHGHDGYRLDFSLLQDAVNKLNLISA